MAVPGLLYANAKITDDRLTPEVLDKWYEEIHIPDVLKTSGFESAIRYKSRDPNAERPYLALYPIKDINFLKTDEFKTIPGHSPLLPGPSHLIYDFVHFDVRVYTKHEIFERTGSKPGPSSSVMVCSMTPPDGGDEDLDSWYKQEHFQAVDEAWPTYRRCGRYKLHLPEDKVEGSGEDSAPSWLTMHQFDGGDVPEDGLAKTAATPLAKKILGDMKIMDVKLFDLVQGFGNLEEKI